MNKGILFALAAYLFWGLHPVYWKLLKEVPASEIVAHRIFWSFIFFVIIISIRKNWKSIIAGFRNSNNKKLLILTAFLISSNWATYIWAVNAGFIVETSLGYFISPLISVLLGVLFLQEKLRSIQWISISIAGAGVLFMTLMYGRLPWISLYLAATWGTYGMFRKKLSFGSVEGLTIETAMLSFPAIIYMAILYSEGTNSFITSGLDTTLLLIGAGITSGLPLMVFIYASKQIELSLIGVLQYIYPTTLFFIGVFIFNEPLSLTKLTGFMFIWSALILYTGESIYFRKYTYKRKKEGNYGIQYK